MNPAARWLCKVGQASRLTHFTWEKYANHTLSGRPPPDSGFTSRKRCRVPLAGQAGRLIYVKASSCHNSAPIRIPFRKGVEAEFLVRRMRIVVGQGEAEQQRVCAEDSLEVRDDR